MLLTEFDEKKFAKTMWDEGHESGFSEGHQQGHDDILTIKDEINKGNNTYEKLTSMGYDPDLVRKVLDRK